MRRALLFVLQLAVVLELVFRTLVPAAELPHPRFDPASGLVVYEAGTSGTFTLGRFARRRTAWRVNAQGWISAHDYGLEKVDHSVALYGNSELEGLLVPPAERIDALLAARLGAGVDVDAFGMSGTFLSHYVATARATAPAVDADALVFFLAPADLESSLATLRPMHRFVQITPDGDSFREVPATPLRIPLVRELGRRSAFVRYLWVDAGLRRAAGGDLVAAVERPRLADDPLLERAATYLVAMLRREHPARLLLFVVDADRDAVDVGRRPLPFPLVGQLERACGDDDRCRVLDLGPPFERAARAGAELTLPENRHWSAAADRAIADAVAPELERYFRSTSKRTSSTEKQLPPLPVPTRTGSLQATVVRIGGGEQWAETSR